MASEPILEKVGKIFDVVVKSDAHPPIGSIPPFRYTAYKFSRQNSYGAKTVQWVT